MSEHDTRPHGCGEDAAPYVLGALSDAEHEAFVAHLRTCAACREEVASLQTVASALPAAVPQLSAPSALRDRVIRTVRSEAELRAETPRPRERRRRSERLPSRLALGGLAAAAAVIVVAALLIGGASSGSTRVIRAHVAVASASATLRVSSTHSTLKIDGMPETAPGHVYEVWLERAGRARPAGALFDVSRAGRATVDVPGSLNGVSAVMVTAEPDGGSRVPTSKPVVVAYL